MACLYLVYYSIPSSVCSILFNIYAFRVFYNQDGGRKKHLALFWPLCYGVIQMPATYSKGEYKEELIAFQSCRAKLAAKLLSKYSEMKQLERAVLRIQKLKKNKPWAGLR